MNIGLFGGSFNPIHNGHVWLAKALLRETGLDEVWFMVSPQNPLKQNRQLLDDNQRFRLVQLALEDEPRLRPCDYEFHLPKPSYTWNTLQALSNDYPDREFVLLMGGDNWSLFDRWFHHEDILRNYEIVVYPRRGSGMTDKMLGAPSPRIVEAELLDISSTEIRQRIKDGKGIRRMVPKAVADFIMENNFYEKSNPKMEKGKSSEMDCMPV